MGPQQGLPPLWGLLSQRGLLTAPILVVASVTAAAVMHEPAEQRDQREELEQRERQGEAQYQSAGLVEAVAVPAWLLPPCAVQRFWAPPLPRAPSPQSPPLRPGVGWRQWAGCGPLPPSAGRGVPLHCR